MREFTEVLVENAVYFLFALLTIYTLMAVADNIIEFVMRPRQRRRK